MASELTLDYSMNYRVTLDIERAKRVFPDDWEASEDEDEFEEWLTDVVLANLDYYEMRKREGRFLPSFITEFSVGESLG